MHIKLGFLMIVFMNSKLCFSRVHTNDCNIIKLSTFWPKLLYLLNFASAITQWQLLIISVIFIKNWHTSHFWMKCRKRTFVCQCHTMVVIAKYYPKILTFLPCTFKFKCTTFNQILVYTFLGGLIGLRNKL